MYLNNQNQNKTTFRYVLPLVQVLPPTFNSDWPDDYRDGLKRRFLM